MLKLVYLTRTSELIIYTICTLSGALEGHMFVCRTCGNLRVVEMHGEGRGHCTCSSADTRRAIAPHEPLLRLLTQE